MNTTDEQSNTERIALQAGLPAMCNYANNERVSKSVIPLLTYGNTIITPTRS